MNARVLRLIQDMLLAIVVSVVLEYGLLHVKLHIALALCPLIWLALRHGGPTGIVAATIKGVVTGLLLGQADNIAQFVLMFITPVLSVGIAGFFAKYTQKTLNNRRLSSTYLNIVTATILVTIAYYILRIITSSLPVVQELASSSLWMGVVMTIVVISLTLCLAARLNKQTIIPRRSKYLSRKETTSLLND